MSPPSERPPWPRAWVARATLALEASVLLAVIAIVASGALAAEPPPAHLPIPLGPREVPALAVVGAYVLLRDRWSLVAGWLARVPPFVLACGATVAAAAAAHPPDELSAPLAGAAGLLTGLLFGWVGMPLHELAADLGGQPRPWRELQVACTLVALGSLGAAARGGAVVAAPTIAAGVLLLLRGAKHDAGDVWRGLGHRAAAALRLALGLGFALLGVGLFVVTTAMSFGLVRLPLDGGR